MLLFNLALLCEKAYTSLNMVLFELTFIVCISYLYFLSVQDETALAIDSLLKVFPFLKTCSSKKEKHSKGKGRIFGSSCHCVNRVYSLFT